MLYSKEEVHSQIALGDVFELCPTRLTQSQEASVSFHLSHRSSLNLSLQSSLVLPLRKALLYIITVSYVPNNMFLFLYIHESAHI